MIKLYIRSGCPFCHKVLDGASQLGLVEGKDYITIDAAPGTAGRETLMQLGGKAMVPFLVDGQTSMYESSDILDYLQKWTNGHS